MATSRLNIQLLRAKKTFDKTVHEITELGFYDEERSFMYATKLAEALELFEGKIIFSKNNVKKGKIEDYSAYKKRITNAVVKLKNIHQEIRNEIYRQITAKNLAHDAIMGKSTEIHDPQHPDIVIGFLLYITIDQGKGDSQVTIATIVDENEKNIGYFSCAEAKKIHPNLKKDEPVLFSLVRDILNKTGFFKEVKDGSLNFH